MAKKPSLSNELMALKTVKSFNDLAKRAEDKAVDSLTLAWKAGELAQTAKDSMPHGEWMKFVKTHYVVDQSTVVRWMKFHASVPESKLRVVRNLAAGTKMLEAPKPKGKTTPPKRKPAPPQPEEGRDPLNVDPFDQAAQDDSEAIWDEGAPEPPPAGKGRKQGAQRTQGGKGKLPKQYDRSALLKTWTQSIGPLIRQVTRIAEGVGEKHGKYHKAVRVHLDKATDIMEEWLGDKK